MKKGAIFDLDGTLVDTVLLHTKAWRVLFSKYGIRLDDEEKTAHSGKQNASFISQVLSKRAITTLNGETLSNEKDEIVAQILSQEAPRVFVGLLPLFEALKHRQARLALATSATKKTAHLLAKNLLHYFDTIVFAEDVNKGKPDPEIFLIAAQRINLTPAECVVFEDSESGVAAAKSGGFMCIAKDNDAGQDLSNADKVIKEYPEIDLDKL